MPNELDATTPTEPPAGTVFLVGAGPGDPGLITVEGLRRLREADAVVYDALANPVLLDEAPSHAERIDVGKRAKHHKMQQDDISALLVEQAQRGRTVVRLKGGDPFLFGRGAEECAYCAAQGVRCVVIPGVTAGIAAPATAGVPVTHRKLASTVTFVTGHEDPTKGETSVDYAGLAALIGKGGTACFYMGVGRLPQIAQQLTHHGLSESTPVAVVQWGTLPTQRTARGTLATIPAALERAGVSSPAIIVVGAVAGLDEPGLDFFTARPLFGQTVLVTRTRQQSSELSCLLRDAGANVLEAPTIVLEAPTEDDAQHTREAIKTLVTGGFDDAVLTSPNAVDALAGLFDATQHDARALHGTRLSVVGDATAARLRERLGVRPDFVPVQTSGQGIAEELIAAEAVAGRRFVLLRADIARPDLPRMLREAGATDVIEAVAYRTRPVDALPPAVVESLVADAVDWVAFTSSSTATNLLGLLGHDRSRLGRARVASIGPQTSATCRELRLNVDVEADSPGVAKLVEAVVSAARMP